MAEERPDCTRLKWEPCVAKGRASDRKAAEKRAAKAEEAATRREAARRAVWGFCAADEVTPNKHTLADLEARFRALLVERPQQRRMLGVAACVGSGVAPTLLPIANELMEVTDDDDDQESCSGTYSVPQLLEPEMVDEGQLRPLPLFNRLPDELIFHIWFQFTPWASLRAVLSTCHTLKDIVFEFLPRQEALQIHSHTICVQERACGRAPLLKDRTWLRRT